MAGRSASAWTTAHPMRWVKLTLPPWVRRASWLLMMRRLTSSSLAGSVRTDVAVGISRLASIRSAITADAPRSWSREASSGTALRSPSACCLGVVVAPALAAAGRAAGCSATLWRSDGR